MNIRNTADRRLYVLKKLAQADASVSVLETSLVGMETLRLMAAHGYIRIEMSMTPKGLGLLLEQSEREEKRNAQAAIRARREAQKRRAATPEPQKTIPIMVPVSSLRKVG